MQLHKSTVLVMLMDVKMQTIVGSLTIMSMTSFMNVLRLICHAGGVKMPTIVGILKFMSMTSFMNVLRLILSRMR